MPVRRYPTTVGILNLVNTRFTRVDKAKINTMSFSIASSIFSGCGYGYFLSASAGFKCTVKLHTNFGFFCSCRRIN